MAFSDRSVIDRPFGAGGCAVSIIPKEESARGPFKKYVTGLGGRGSSQIVTKCDKEEGVKQRVMSLLQKDLFSTITIT